jgi:hypothetical protein
MRKLRRDRKRHQRKEPPRQPLTVMLTRPIYRIVAILAADDGVSASRMGAELIADALGLDVPLRRRKVRP